MTTVISVRGRNRDDLLADPSFAYVGRRVRYTEWEDSVWGNPFKAGMNPFAAMRVFDGLSWEDVRAGSHHVIKSPFTSDDAVEWYESYVKARRSLWERLPELRGKTLGCWCCNYRVGDPIVTPCHAIVLAHLADGVELNTTEAAR